MNKDAGASAIVLREYDICLMEGTLRNLRSAKGGKGNIMFDDMKTPLRTQFIPLKGD